MPVWLKVLGIAAVSNRVVDLKRPHPVRKEKYTYYYQVEEHIYKLLAPATRFLVRHTRGATLFCRCIDRGLSKDLYNYLTWVTFLKTTTSGEWGVLYKLISAEHFTVLRDPPSQRRTSLTTSGAMETNRNLRAIPRNIQYDPRSNPTPGIFSNSIEEDVPDPTQRNPTGTTTQTLLRRMASGSI